VVHGRSKPAAYTAENSNPNKHHKLHTFSLTPSTKRYFP
jgi:hypothetical protein